VIAYLAAGRAIGDGNEFIAHSLESIASCPILLNVNLPLIFPCYDEISDKRLYPENRINLNRIILYNDFQRCGIISRYIVLYAERGS
jgi:hypothetical protein